MQLPPREKMLIEAFKAADFSGQPEMSYTFALNPKSFSRCNYATYHTTQAGGTSGSDSRFAHICPEVLKFSFMIDGTGIDGEKHERTWTVEQEVKDFRKLLSYQGTTHEPFPLKVVWGKLVFKGVMRQCNYTYTLFDAQARPLRANLDVVIFEKITDKMRDQGDKATSPDLTHVRVVKEGDTLPMMAQQIYGDPRYYLSVARANGLNNYRRLKPGQKIFFPPLK